MSSSCRVHGLWQNLPGLGNTIDNAFGIMIFFEEADEIGLIFRRLEGFFLLTMIFVSLNRNNGVSNVTKEEMIVVAVTMRMVAIEIGTGMATG